MAGGFLTNVVWCAVLSLKKRTWGELRPAISGERASLATNYLLCALAGVIWYLQFFFYSMGSTRMGRYDFSSWTLHMASIIIFSTLWGISLQEWKGTSVRHPAAGGGGPRPPRGLDGGRRLRELPRGSRGDPLSEIQPQAPAWTGRWLA